MAVENKKGMFFTLVAIALLSLMFVSYSVYSFVNDRSGIESRVDSMNRYIFSLEEDLARKVYITGFRIIFIYEKRIAETGTYAANINSTFSEAFFNGTIEGVMDDSESTLMNGVLFEDIIDNINTDANSIDLVVNFSNPSVEIDQVDPWNVRVRLLGNLEITDLSGLASWNQSSEIETFIPINLFEDPLYMVKTNGLVPRKFNQTPYANFVSGSDVSNLTSHLGGFYYYNSSLAPSFLNRLQGDFSSDSQGVESLVYLPDLASQGFSLKDKSIVDYIYFSTDNPSDNGVNGMPSWFKLDTGHHDVYGVSGIII